MEKTSLEQLIEDTRTVLERNGASEYHLKVFKKVTRQLLLYAEANGIKEYSQELGLEFLEKNYHMSDKYAGKKFPAIYLYCINELFDVRQKGDTHIYFGRFKREYDIPAGFRSSNDAYLAYRSEIGISSKSITGTKLYLERFFRFLNEKSIRTPQDITLDSVFAFLKAINEHYEKTTVNHNMRAVKFYLKFCFDNGIIEQNIYENIPNINYCRQSRLPSVYTADEVRKLIDSIDFGNPCGKRDYAIVLLIARSGLRASDIADMRFSDIDWENMKIIKVQKKTGKPIELPLLNDVGDAVIDYLKNARPQSDSDHIFVKHRPPNDCFGSSAVGAIVRRLMQHSEIKLQNRKCGSHALRHSLASRLLECGVPMPVISEILGHSDTASTMTYLRIDIASLRTCALEVEI
ncbi:MAG: site-specific integrase [Ruminococcus sp.]|nr:site-specific integrase [Ruminococcus sp.]